MLTDADQVVRLKDVPERFQASFFLTKLLNVAPWNESEANAAAVFTTQKLIKELGSPPPVDVLQKVVYKIIKFILKENYEIPFIYAHRKDHYVPYLDRTSLWRIFDLVLEWQQINQSRSKVVKLIDDLSTADVMSMHDVKRFRSLLTLSESLLEISDVQGCIQSKYSEQMSGQPRNTFKRPSQRTPVSDAKKSNLGGLVRQFGVDVERLAVALRNTLPNSYNPSIPDRSPQECAEEYKCALFPTTSAVLDGACELLAYEISHDPSIKQFIRRIYETDAVVTVKPSERGKKEITHTHPLYVRFI